LYRFTGAIERCVDTLRVMDPRAMAQRKFETPPPWTGLDLLARCATDPPMAISTLVDAARPDRVGEHRICELGFGEGWLLEELLRAMPDAHLCGLDQSQSYVRRLREKLGDRVRVVRGDMEAPPFADRSFDVMLTCWTLYLMRDIDAALDSMKRCLRPGGRFVAATVAPDHMRDYEDLVDEAVRRALGHEREPDVGTRFDLETGDAYMRRHFARVELREWQGVLTLPDTDTALQLWTAYRPDGLDSDQEAAALIEYRRLTQELLRRYGEIAVRRHDGAFVATDA
jgi:SAM-dependent methyltransferase